LSSGGCGEHPGSGQREGGGGQQLLQFLEIFHHFFEEYFVVVDITLIGRPGRIVEKGEVVLTSMQASKAPSLPKGLPPVPIDPTTYVVFIAQKQWKKVAQAIKEPQDMLIVEGYPVLDKRLGTITVFVQSVTTRLLQAAKREAGQKQ
jgi:hypothetical protein